MKPDQLAQLVKERRATHGRSIAAAVIYYCDTLTYSIADKDLTSDMVAEAWAMLHNPQGAE